MYKINDRRKNISTKYGLNTDNNIFSLKIFKIIQCFTVHCFILKYFVKLLEMIVLGRNYLLKLFLPGTTSVYGQWHPDTPR